MACGSYYDHYHCGHGYYGYNNSSCYCSCSCSRSSCTCSSSSSSCKKPVVLKVNMTCNKCKKKILNALSNIKGATDISVDLENQKVTVKGDVTEEECIRKIEKLGKTVKPWPKREIECKKPEIIYVTQYVNPYVNPCVTCCASVCCCRDSYSNSCGFM